MGRGVSGCATCDGFFYRGQEVCVVGGGNTAVEEALYLSNIASKVHVVHRRDKFRAEAILVDKLMAKVDDGKMRAAPLVDARRGARRRQRASPACASAAPRTTRPRRSRLTGCFIAIGHQPNTDIFKGQLEMKRRLHPDQERPRRLRDDDQRAGRLRRRRRPGPRLPAGGHQRRHRLHGGARRPALPRAGLSSTAIGVARL